MTLDEFKTLFDYDKWATDRLLGVVGTLTDEQYRKDLGSSFGGVRGTLVHIYGADRIWLDRWKGSNPKALVKEAEIPYLKVLTLRWDALRVELADFLASLSDQKLQEPLSYTDTQGVPYTQPLYRLMQHRINHSTYHRGQIVTFLRQLGMKPPGTDLIVFYRQEGK